MLKFPAGFLAAVMASIGGFAILVSCKRPDTEIGLGYSQNDILVLEQDTLPLRCQTVREDSLKTNNYSTAVLGRMHHPDFGWHSGGFVSQLRLSAPDIDFGAAPVVDSIYLSLRYTGDAYGHLSPQHVFVRELMDSLSLDSSYYSNAAFGVLDEALEDAATQPITLNPNQSLYIANDTVAPEVRIYLNDALGQRLLDADPSHYASNTAWSQYFKGIHVMPDEFGGGQGAVGIDMISGLSVMRLHYHNATDTAQFDFIISSLSARVNLFMHEWSGPFQALNEEFITGIEGEQYMGVFNGAGTKVRIEFPSLDAFRDSTGPQRAVHKAELWLPVDPAHNDTRYPLPAHFFILTENEEGGALFTPDQNSIGLNINGNYDAVAGAYRFNISQTFQRMLNDDLEVDFLHVVSSNAAVSFQGVLLNGSAFSPNDPEANARLVLTWSD